MDSPINRLVDRARAAMNLILALTLVLTWASFDRNPGVIGLVETVYEYLHLATPEHLSTRTLVFVVEVDEGKKSGRSFEQVISDIPVFEILSIADAQLTDAFPTTKDDFIEARPRLEGEASPFAVELDRRDYFTVLNLTNATIAAAKSTRNTPDTAGGREDADQALDFAAALIDEAVQAEQDRDVAYSSAPEARQITSALLELEHAYDAAKLPPRATIALLNRASRELIKIPFVEQDVQKQTASLIITIALLGPYLYLASICLTLRKSAKVTIGSDGADWIFFHVGNIGPILGTFWLLSPAAVALSSNLYFGDGDKTGDFLFGVIGVVGAIVVRLALDTRLAYRSLWEN